MIAYTSSERRFNDSYSSKFSENTTISSSFYESKQKHEKLVGSSGRSPQVPTTEPPAPPLSSPPMCPPLDIQSMDLEEPSSDAPISTSSPRVEQNYTNQSSNKSIFEQQEQLSTSMTHPEGETTKHIQESTTTNSESSSNVYTTSSSTSSSYTNTATVHGHQLEEDSHYTDVLNITSDPPASVRSSTDSDHIHYTDDDINEVGLVEY